MPSLEDWGWEPFFASQLTAEELASVGGALVHAPARVIEEQKRYYRIVGDFGEHWAEPVGKMTHAASTRAELPGVGDWVVASVSKAAERASIHRTLARKSKLSREAAGQVGREQIIAANIDVVFVVDALNERVNASRLERFVAVARASGARPVLLLSKSDLCTDADERARSPELVKAAGGAPLHIVSSVTKRGLAELAAELAPGRTACFVGPSGAGKSTLVNWLAGRAVQGTGDVRSGDEKGRHTTTSRRLVLLDRGMVIDTPGMREMHVWIDETSADSFDDVEALGLRCKFSNCRHETEPGCAVKAAVVEGRLAAARHEEFLKARRR